MLANFSNLITFSRGSNATVTDASGRLTYAANNLVTNSQDFEASAWNGAGLAAKTANIIAAPDGTVTGDRLVINNSSIQHRVDFTPSSPVGFQIFSVYLKQDTYRWVSLRIGSVGATFDLQNGVVGATNTATARGMTVAGNGWYRCFILVSAAANDVCRINVENADAIGTSFVGDNTTGVYLWGAQLEAVTYQTTPSPYVSTSVANLLGFSEDFTNAAWTKQRASIVPNAAQNPINGLWTAQKLMEDTTASNSHRVSSALITMPSGILSTVSVYMKAAERTWGYITDAGVTNSGAYVNLATGEFGTIAGGVTRSSIQSVGNGWYRVSISGYLAGTLSQLFVSVATSNGNFSYTGDGNSGIYIYGAQLSNSGSLDPYVPTPGAAPSSTAYYGPRFDYDPVTLAAKGILIEEQRTNLFTYSEQLDNAAWLLANATVVANSTASPDGASNAELVRPDTLASVHAIYRNAYTVTANAAHTMTVYAKAGGYNFIALAIHNGSVTAGNEAIQMFNLSNGTLGSSYNTAPTSASITPVGNGWYRCSMTWAVTTTTLNPAYFPMNADTNPRAPWSGNNTSGVFIYGAQLEAGAFATSYIPTVASQVTRTADVASITGSLFNGWYRQDQGVILVTALGYAATTVPNGSAAPIAVSLYDTPAASQYASINIFRRDVTTINSPTGNIISAAGVAGADLQENGVSWLGAVVKAGMSWNGSTDAAFSANGLPVKTDTSYTLPVPDTLQIGRLGSEGVTGYWNGHIRNITYIPNAVSASQLQSATS